MATKSIEELAIPVAFGRGGRPYRPEEIGELAEAIANDELVDRYFRPVKANPGTARAQSHFSLIGTPSASFARADNDPLHNKTIDELVGRLHAAAEFEVHVRDKVGDAVREFSLFKSHPSSSYDWVQEPQTRIWTPGQAFVQPDISGIDMSRRYPGTSNQSLIIEVIRTHAPDAATWKSLVDLSKWHHLVLLYFVGAGSTVNKQNKHWGRNAVAHVKVRFYLKAGLLYDGARLLLGGADVLDQGKCKGRCFDPGKEGAVSDAP